jgi:hypothetical protein
MMGDAEAARRRAIEAGAFPTAGPAPKPPRRPKPRHVLVTGDRPGDREARRGSVLLPARCGSCGSPWGETEIAREAHGRACPFCGAPR